MSRRNPAARGKRDEAHVAFTKLYEIHGVKVHDTSMVGNGFPDAVVTIPSVTDLSEFKGADDDRYTPAQIKFHGEWPGPLWTIYNDDDVIAHVQDMRRRQILLRRP